MDSSNKVEVQGSEVQLKHLGFVRILTLNAVVLVSNIYDSVKQNSGPLKSTVITVENAVTSLAAPFYEKFKGLPSYLLVFIDNRVDEATYKFDECAPPAAKNVMSKAQSLLNKASEVVQDLAEEAKVAGPFAAISRVGAISKNIAINQLVVVWYKANQYPALHNVSEIAIPTATHLSQKYNKLVKDLTAKGYSLFSYVPLVPVEELEKAYKQVEAAASKKEVDTGKRSSGSESDDKE